MGCQCPSLNLLYCNASLWLKFLKCLASTFICFFFVCVCDREINERASEVQKKITLEWALWHSRLSQYLQLLQPILRCSWVLDVPLLIQTLANVPRMVVQGLGFLPPEWETWLEFLDLRFKSIHPGFLWAFWDSTSARPTFLSCWLL